MSNRNLGVRIIFKRDSESSVGRGAVIYRAHFRPEMANILYSAALTAPRELGEEMWVTEGFRSVRPTRDLHEECRAFDIDCTRISASSYTSKYNISQNWANSIANELGPDYQIILHGGEKGLHLHIELDW